jgi:hypothetical protein
LNFSAIGRESHLCLTKSDKGIELLSPTPTTELITYLDGLQAGKYLLNWNIDNHQAAAQLGFGNRFAEIYGQLAEEAQLRLKQNGSLTIQEMTGYLNAVVAEEKSIDDLGLKRDEHLSSIVYLRALQEGECSFPAAIGRAPDPTALLGELRRVYPEFHLEARNATFTAVYNQAVDASHKRITQMGGVSIFRNIEDLRHAILGEQELPPTIVAQTGSGWFAISVAPAGTFGWSYEHSGKDEAEEEALRNCTSVTADPRTCRTVVVAKGTCVAVAQCNVSGQKSIWIELNEHIKDAIDGSFHQAVLAGVPEVNCKALTNWCPQ